jgi:hypothetical protein
MTTHQQKFYERIGFIENQTTTMILSNDAANVNDYSFSLDSVALH